MLASSFNLHLQNPCALPIAFSKPRRRHLHPPSLLFSTHRIPIVRIHRSDSSLPPPAPPLRPLRSPSLLAPLIRSLSLALASAALLLPSLFPLRPSLASTTTAHTPSATHTAFEEQHPNDAFSGDVGSLIALLELSAKSGDYPKALSAVDRLLSLQPSDPDISLLRAHLLAYSGECNAARAAFEDLVSNDPFLVQGYHGLVTTSFLSDDKDASSADLAEIVKRMEEVMQKCKKGKMKEQLREFKLLMALVKVMEGNHEQAISMYKELVKEEPRDFRPYLCQGMVYSALKRNDEAEKQFEKYRRLVPQGHAYARYLDENLLAMKAVKKMEEKKDVDGTTS